MQSQKSIEIWPGFLLNVAKHVHFEEEVFWILNCQILGLSMHVGEMFHDPLPQNYVLNCLDKPFEWDPPKVVGGPILWNKIHLNLVGFVGQLVFEDRVPIAQAAILLILAHQDIYYSLQEVLKK